MEAAAADGFEGVKCQTPGCDNDAKLRCPTCIKLQLSGAHFCSQECFKGFWSEHKKVHLAKKLVDTCNHEQPYNPWPTYRFSGSLRPFVQSGRRDVPDSIARPDYADHPQGVSLEEKEARFSSQIKVLTDEEEEGLRLACRLARQVLNEAAKTVGVGVTADEIDRVVHEACIERDCYPSPLGYYGFPKSVCTSVNEVICHGIPDLRPLQNGDICDVDVTVYHRGFHGDLNETFLVGDAVDEATRKLVRVTHECISQAIDIVRPGVKFREIGNVIQKHANANGMSVVRTYCGHGIHRLFHTAPNVPHYSMSWPEVAAWQALSWIGIENKAIGVMQAGNSFTIEPMINAGHYSDAKWPDDWTAVTKDGKRSAQFEQTLLVTETGCDILTKRLEHDGRPWFEDQLLQFGYDKQAP